MNGAMRFFILGLLLTGSSAYGIGFCRDCPCEGPNCAQKENPCDEHLLNELKQKRDQKVKAYKEIVAMSEETAQREAEALAEAQEQFAQYAEKIAGKGVVTVGKDVFQVPDEIVSAYKAAMIGASDKPASEKYLKFVKLCIEAVAKNVGYKLAVERAKWVDTAVSGVLMDAMVLTKLKEAEFHAEQAFNQWLRGYEALMEARHLEDRIRKLEAECKSAAKGDSAGSEEDSDFKTSGERDAAAAKKMLDGWKKVEGGFEDSEGNFYSADLAFEEALAIVQSQQSRVLDTTRWLALFSFPARPLLVKDMTEAEMDAEWNRFREPLRRAFELVIKGVESYHRAEQQFHLLGKSPTGSGQQPAQSEKSKSTGK